MRHILFYIQIYNLKSSPEILLKLQEHPQCQILKKYILKLLAAIWPQIPLKPEHIYISRDPKVSENKIQ